MRKSNQKSIQFALTEAVELLRDISDSPHLDAEILINKVLNKDRAHLRAWPEKEITKDQYQKFSSLIAKRQQGEPIAYLTGVKEFWSREFIVTPDVLIPRPETELLIELILQHIPQDNPCKILDLGTGSGIIAITLAKERPNADVIATDISAAALKVAQLNADKHQSANVRLIQSRWLEDVPPVQFDFITSNPPYVAQGDPHLEEGDLRFEPKTALISGDEGLANIKLIAQTALKRLAPKGKLIVEHGYQQGVKVGNLFISLGYQNVKTFEDLAGLPRVTFGQNPVESNIHS